MGVRNAQLSKVEAQSLSGVFDVDYQLVRKAEPVSDRKLSAQEWEQKMRDEERAERKGRAQRMREDLEEAPPSRLNSRFGAFSGANVVEADVGEDKTTVEGSFTAEITEEQKNKMRAQGINVDHLETGKKVKVAKINWS